MATIVNTYGTTEGLAKSALMGLGATQQDPNGRFYLDGSMVNVELSNVIAETIYIGDIFRNGQSVTEKYTTDRKAGAIRVMLDTPFDFTSRTLGYGGRKGTAGNGGVINTNPDLLPTNDEFMVYLNQANDQSMVFPDISKEYIPLDVMAKKVAAYAKSVVQDRSASTLAEIIAYNIPRALNGGDNINTFDKTVDFAYGELLSELNTKLDNGDIVTGAYTFSTEGRTIIGRPAFINGIFGKNSGVILNGSNLAQEMLREYDLSANISDKGYVGQGYKGHFGQFHFQSAPDYIWTLAERYLGLKAGDLKGVQAIAVSYEANAMGKVIDLGVKFIDANTVRGIKMQPLNLWGHEAFRKSQIIGDRTITNDFFISLGFSADTRVYPVAPTTANRKDQVTVPIYDADGKIVGYRTIAEGISPNGGNFSNRIPQAEAPVADKPSGGFETTISVALTTGTSGANVYYTTDGSIPTAASTLYSAAIVLTATTTIKAMAIKTGFRASYISEYTYTKTN